MTLSPRDLQTYRRLRRFGRGDSDCMLPERAIDALRAVKWENRKAALPLSQDGDSYETEDGFTVTLKIEGDYGYSLGDYLGDCYGEVTDGKPDRNRVTGVIVSSDRFGRERAYFPSKHWAFEDRRAQYRKAGMAKGAAFLAAMAGLQKEADTYEKMHDDGVEIFWLQCKAYRTEDYDENGEDADELGEDSIGGVSADDWEHCLTDYCLHENALKQARKAWSVTCESNARELEQSRPDLYAYTVENEART